jgi:cell pole-organizing protein PopZ
MSGAADSRKPAAGDPAMDDILASIRRILNEDEAQAAQKAAEAPKATEEPIDLTESMLVQPATAPAPEPAVPVAAPAVSLPAVSAPVVAAPVVAASPPQPAPGLPAAMPVDGLVAPAVAAATTAAFGQLLRAVSQERNATVTRGGPSIEDVVREELRPLLKEWLDQHLPPLVERLVRAEIERVVGRALP